MPGPGAIAGESFLAEAVARRVLEGAHVNTFRPRRFGFMDFAGRRPWPGRSGLRPCRRSTSLRNITLDLPT
ncbi:hypothetical protein GCM10027176_74610 [Actinoallomurus bryophytorum]|uniref:Uncharacterized protein n=1 Tax=Actinoallomurus bryophytorum TaxID=1490222 RepID=A0A543CRM5_9ACTN|nr:hypothetical protein FB559_5464 [Actinoallomurus bryophytorum]